MGETIQDYGVIDGKLMVVMGNRTELVSSNWGTLVRKDWMDALGIDMPTNLDEYNDMLMKFKEAGYGYASAPLLAKPSTLTTTSEAGRMTKKAELLTPTWQLLPLPGSLPRLI